MHVMVTALGDLISECLLHQRLEPVWFKHGVRLQYLLDFFKQMLSASCAWSLPPWSMLLKFGQMLKLGLQMASDFLLVALLWYVN